MNFPTLYKRTKTGAIQYWRISVEDPIRLKTDGDYAFITKESGQLHTSNPTIHSETITSGKQKRTYIQQAEFMAQADWKKKKDEGYKSLLDLGIDDVEDPAWQGSRYYYQGKWYGGIAESLRLALPEFNTDASGNIKPMLATDWKKIKKIEYPIYCEPKLDGVRCLMIVQWWPDSTLVEFLSRTGKEYSTLDHITNHIEQYIDKTESPEGKFILDGEIYSDELTFQEIVSAVKAYKPNSLKLHFRAYDVVTEGIQSERRAALIPLVNAIGSEFIQHIEWHLAHSEQRVMQLHEEFVGRGYEGAILRDLDGKYAQGQRSRELMKVKEFDSEEFVFKNFEFGQRGVEDLIAVCWTADGNTEFRAKMIGTAAQKHDLYDRNNRDELEGTSLTVKFFGYTEGGAGIPRFPIGISFRNYE